MNVFQYWRLVFRTAFRHSFSLAQNVLFGLLIAVGAAAWFVPPIKAELTKAGIDVAGAELAAIVLGLIVLARLVMAPYWVYQQQTATIASLNKRLKNRLSKKQIREQLGVFMERGKRILVTIHRDGILPEKELNEWDDDVKMWLNEHLDSSYGARFRNPKTHPEPPPGIGSETLRLAWTGTRFRLDNLREMLEEFT